jgi:hypothetical protein
MPRAQLIYDQQTFEQFIQDNFSASDFLYPVASELGWTKTRLTQYCNNPKIIPLNKLYELADFLQQDEEQESFITHLMNAFECGKDVMTGSEIDSIKAKAKTDLISQA